MQCPAKSALRAHYGWEGIAGQTPFARVDPRLRPGAVVAGRGGAKRQSAELMRAKLTDGRYDSANLAEAVEDAIEPLKKLYEASRVQERRTLENLPVPCFAIFERSSE